KLRVWGRGSEVFLSLAILFFELIAVVDPCVEGHVKIRRIPVGSRLVNHVVPPGADSNGTVFRLAIPRGVPGHMFPLTTGCQVVHPRALWNGAGVNGRIDDPRFDTVVFAHNVDKGGHVIGPLGSGLVREVWAKKGFFFNVDGSVLVSHVAPTRDEDF